MEEWKEIKEENRVKKLRIEINFNYNILLMFWRVKIVSLEMIEIATNFVMMLASAFLASYLTYTFAIKRIQQEKLLSERVALYRPLIHSLSSLMEKPESERMVELENKLNRINRELLLYASDNIYRAFQEAMGSVKKGASVKPLIQFMVILRKELMPQSKIMSEDIFELKLRP